jgi:hypothetical protein
MLSEALRGTGDKLNAISNHRRYSITVGKKPVDSRCEVNYSIPGVHAKKAISIVAKKLRKERRTWGKRSII